MRRAILRASLLCIATALLFAAEAVPQQSLTLVNGIGLVDYTRKPDFRIGSWVRYHTTSSSNLGAKDDYVVTVVIAGEERFWGEDGFWVETWTEFKDRPPQAVATLMSYSIFSDTLPIPHMQLYMRKSISGVSESGEPTETLVMRPVQTLRTRNPIGEDISWATETLPPDTAHTPKGSYACSRTLYRQGTGATQDQGDSTIYTEQRENRTVFFNTAVPITHLVIEGIERTFSRRAWLVGRSKEAAPIALVERGQGAARLVDFGEGMEPRLVPARYRKPVRTAASAASPAPKPAPPARAPAAAGRKR